MGITISHRLKLQTISVKKTLDRTQKLAEEIKKNQATPQGVEMDVQRRSETELCINIDGCETLGFNFMTKNQIMEDNKNNSWSYKYSSFTNDGKTEIDNGYCVEMYPQNEISFCTDFCKTQYAETFMAHKWVCDLIRSVAGYCHEANISDEADFYYTGNVEEGKKTIQESGEMINRLGEMLSNTLGNVEIIKGGDTTIKPLKN